MSSYSLSPEAKKDLLDIHAYTQNEWGRQQAQKYIYALEKRCDELAQSPHIGRERPEIKPGYRSSVLDTNRARDGRAVRHAHLRMSRSRATVANPFASMCAIIAVGSTCRLLI